jgi:hypothetical protein
MESCEVTTFRLLSFSAMTENVYNDNKETLGESALPWEKHDGHGFAMSEIFIYWRSGKMDRGDT